MASKSFEATLEGRGLRFGFVVGRFNTLITERLVEGAMDCLVRHGVSKDDIDVMRVPGAWEMPLGLEWLAKKDYDALVAIGCVIRGGTPHFEYVAGEAAKGAATIQRQSGLPIGLGLLTTDTIEQAIERAGTKHGNKGWEAAMAALEMAALKKQLG